MDLIGFFLRQSGLKSKSLQILNFKFWIFTIVLRIQKYAMQSYQWSKQNKFSYLLYSDKGNVRNT